MNPTQTLKELRAHILRDIQSDVKAIVKATMAQPELLRREYFDRLMVELSEDQSKSLGLDKSPLYALTSIGTKLVITDLVIYARGMSDNYASFTEKIAVSFTADLADTPEGALTPDQLIEKDWYFVHTTILIDKADNVPADYIEQTLQNAIDASAEYLARFKERDRFNGNQAAMSIRHLEVVDRSRTPVIPPNYRDLLAKRKKGKNKPF